MDILGDLIMAKWSVGKGAQEYVDQLVRLEALTPEMMGKSIYPAAAIIADAIKANIETIPVSNSSKRGTPEDPIDSITSAQKEGLRQGLGIAALKDENGFMNVKVGFDGYNSTVSTRAKKAGWANIHQANQMIARAVEGGTSFRKKHPFVSPAVRKNRKAAEEKMAEVLDEQIQKITE